MGGGAVEGVMLRMNDEFINYMLETYGDKFRDWFDNSTLASIE